MAKLSIDIPANGKDLYKAANGSELKDAIEYHVNSWLVNAERILIQRSVEDDKVAVIAAEINKFKTKEPS